MKTQLLRAASSLALIAAMSTTAISQTGTPQPGDGAKEKQSPAQSERARPGSGGTTEMPKGKGGSAERPSDRPKASERAQEKASPKSAVKNDDKGDEPRRSRAAGDSAKDKDDNARASGDRSKDGKQQSRDDDRKDRPRTAGDRDRDRKGDRDRAEKGDSDRAGKGKAAQGKRDDRGERVQISEQKRTSVRERLSKHAKGHRARNVNFDVRVGVNIPRNVTVYALPPEVVEIVPEYRSYRYVYVGDQILIVDPDDYVVVAVLGSDSRTAGRRGGSFTLAADDRVFFRRHVERGPSIRLGIGGISIGMNLPDSVELRPVPSVVVERLPDFRGHRYFYYEDEIVIVDPATREVVYVIED
jgi:hypothetical protein